MTYLPPANGGRINATISGNTAGAGALVSTGTMTLAGGNNITLSQNGNAITISGGAGGAAGTNTLGMSNLGNSVGTSGVISGSALQYLLAGGNNVTLSQSLNGSSGTVTISAANQTVQTQNLHNVTLSGNTAGVMAHVSSGTLTLAGGNNVTLSQNGNAVTVSAANQTVQTQNVHNVSLSGNTAGAMAHISSGTLTLAGGNNITLSQNGNAVTISAGAGGAGGSNTIGISNLGNTSGTSGVISGSALQYALAGGNNIVLSQSLDGSSGTVTISAASQTNQTVGLYALGNTTQNSSTTLDARTMSFNGLGAATMGYSNGSIQVSAPATSSLSATGAVSISTNGSTISIGAPPTATLSHWIHNSAAMNNSTSSNMGNASVSLVRMLIPTALSFTRVEIPVSVSGATSATANTAAMALSAIGVLYSRNASTLNPIIGQSSTTTFSYASNTGVYSSVTGPRLFSFNLATTLSAGEYYFGFQMSSATSSVGTATTNLGWSLAPVFGSTNTVAPWMNMSASTTQTINLYQPMQGVNNVAITNTAQTHQQSQVSHALGTGARANIVVIFRDN